MSSAFVGVPGHTSIELSSLVGQHVIDARAEVDGHGRVVYYRIDGLVHAFVEDDSDDYRSMLREVMRWDHGDVSRFDVSFAIFDPIVVNIIHHTNGDDIIAAINERTGLAMLEIGTENNDDWYPSFVSRWYPDGVEPRWPGH